MTTATDKLASSAAAIDTTTNGVASAASAVANSSTAKSLDNALATMINASVQGAGDAIAWAKYQIPDVIHQLLVWQCIKHCIYVLCSSLILTICCFVIKHCILKIKEYKAYNRTVSYGDSKDIEGWVILCLVSTIVSLTLFCAAISDLLTVLQIWIAPKIYLLEYAAQLLKGTH